MTELYDKHRKFEGKLKPYPHEELGVEVRSTIFWIADDCGCSIAGDRYNAHSYLIPSNTA